jgi:hypothetical protein
MNFNSRSLVLAGRAEEPGGSPAIAVPSQLTAASPLDTHGPVRLLHQAYSLGGQRLENYASRLAHKLGHGPEAVAIHIEKAFSDDVQARESRLDGLHGLFNGLAAAAKWYVSWRRTLED